MKFSIITATYNSSSTIANCISSVNEQTYNTLEHVLVDGLSEDNTCDLINSFRKSNSKFLSEPDGGIYDALNKAIKLASGDVIGFLHSDDIFASSEVLKQISHVFETENVDGVYGDLVYVSKLDTNKTVRYWKSELFNQTNLKYGWMPAHPTLFLKREVYIKHGSFDLDYKISGDYDFMLRVLKDSDLRFQYLPKVITKMRVGGASNRSLKNIIQKSKEDFRAIQNNNCGGYYTLVFKNIRKIIQFIEKGKNSQQ